jgi:hypothetical protein
MERAYQLVKQIVSVRPLVSSSYLFKTSDSNEHNLSCKATTDSDWSLQLTLAVFFPDEERDSLVFLTSDRYIPVKIHLAEVQSCFVCVR